MIVISLENELPEYRFANFIEYKIKIHHKYLTITQVQIRTRGRKLPSSTKGTIKSCLGYVL